MRASTCSPDAMSFNRYVPASISLSPRISAKRAPVLLATSSARFSFLSADRSTENPCGAQFGRQRARVLLGGFAHAAPERRPPPA